MSAQLLWRKVLKATIDTLEGSSRGQYHISLPQLAGIPGFLAGLPQSAANARGGYDVVVPLEPAPPPLGTAAATITVSYIGAGSERADWRIRSQRPETAYPLWRPGVGLLPGTPVGRDFVVLLRDPAGDFHARWLRGTQLSALPPSLAARLRSRRAAGVELLDAAAWTALAGVLLVPSTAAPPPAAATPPAASAPPAAARRSAPPAPAVAARPAPGPAGTAYRPETEPAASAPRDAFEVDPDAVDRGTHAHWRIQQELMEHLLAVGLKPLSATPRRDPPFDIGWREGDGTLVVAEVKSLTRRNEERQLRLGLGQVLRYAHLLRATEAGEVQPALVVERAPADASWGELCAALGVRLAWPATFGELTA